MRRFDKDKHIKKANLLAESRHLESKGIVSEDVEVVYESNENKTDVSSIMDALNKCEAGEFDLFGDEKIMYIFTNPPPVKYSKAIGVKYLINFLTRTITMINIREDGDYPSKERVFSRAFGGELRVTPEENDKFKKSVMNILKKSI